jgi:hypothetical protein
MCLPKVKVKVTLRATVSRPVRLGVRHPSGTSDQFFLLLEIFFRQLRDCYFVAPSLMRGRVCDLLLLLVLASAVPILETPRPGEPGPRINIPQEQGGPNLSPGSCVCPLGAVF